MQRGKSNFFFDPFHMDQKQSKPTHGNSCRDSNQVPKGKDKNSLCTPNKGVNLSGHSSYINFWTMEDAYK